MKLKLDGGVLLFSSLIGGILVVIGLMIAWACGAL